MVTVQVLPHLMTAGACRYATARLSSSRRHFIPHTAIAYACHGVALTQGNRACDMLYSVEQDRESAYYCKVIAAIDFHGNLYAQTTSSPLHISRKDQQ